jgi:hypothetical protein
MGHYSHDKAIKSQLINGVGLAISQHPKSPLSVSAHPLFHHLQFATFISHQQF